MHEVCVPDMCQKAPDSGSSSGFIQSQSRRIWPFFFLEIELEECQGLAGHGSYKKKKTENIEEFVVPRRYGLIIVFAQLFGGCSQAARGT
jgi:hypothetical protein